MRPGFLLRPSSRAIAGILILDNSQIRRTGINAPGDGMKGHNQPTCQDDR
ncbi:hypothetical protein [Okeania sp. SIO2G5]|nr:hypothetical protein [Okeania sp. SIO2G5]NEP76346.1 hypothetical protein [Okeania sp. SIO2G5]